MRLNSLQFTIRQIMLAVALTAVLMAYFGSYYRLSRRGMREGAEFGIVGFLYVPVQNVTEDKGLLTHSALMILYAPLNRLDHKIFGAPGPTICLMRLSG
jgi:hypothetical protein